MSRLSGHFASVVWNPGSIADGNEEAKEITVPGANLGDFAFCSLDVDVTDLELSAQVTAADTVTASLSNNTGGALDVGAATTLLRVKVVPIDAI